ncbi:hypothetical protein GCM10010331_69930 [Streptomyces xanthochromogenes]|nr:hypothetical protein GCM10010331_69930 [Streptomyces xanthochromogenes]
MSVIADLPADPQSAEPVEMGERALANTALSAQPRAVPGAPAGDRRLHSQPPDQATVFVVVTAAIGEDNVRAVPGSAVLAPHWRDRFK